MAAEGPDQPDRAGQGQRRGGQRPGAGRDDGGTADEPHGRRLRPAQRPAGQTGRGAGRDRGPALRLSRQLIEWAEPRFRLPVNTPDNDAAPNHSLLKRGLWRLLLLGVGLMLGVGLPYLWYLDKQVRDQFAQLNWQVPPTVYARPLLLKPNARLDGATLELELQAGGYKDDGQGRIAGTYDRDGGRFRLTTREFFDVNRRVPSRQLA